jgi:transposase InsO family protein
LAHDVVDEAVNETKVERILAQVEVSWSNSVVEAIWRKLKHDWLFLNRLDSFATIERLVAFYIEQYSSVSPHSALKGRTPDEVFRGEAMDLPERLREAQRAAIQERIAVNRRHRCDDYQVAARAREGSQ